MSESLIICPLIPFGFQSSLQYYVSYLTAVAIAHPTLNTPSIDYSCFLIQTRMYGPIDLSLPLLDRWHWSVYHIIQMQHLQLFFSARPIASNFTPETHFLEHGLVRRNNTRRLGHFQCVFLRTPNQHYPTFKGPLMSLAKTPLKRLV